MITYNKEWKSDRLERPPYIMYKKVLSVCSTAIHTQSFLSDISNTMDYQKAMEFIKQSRLLSTDYSIQAEYVSQNAYKYAEWTNFEDMVNTEHYAQRVIDTAESLQHKEYADAISN